MATTVTYNGQQPWGIYPPFVSVETTPVSFGQNWYETRSIALEGRLSVKMLDDLGYGINQFETMRTDIEATFSTNNKQFKVTSSDTLEMDNVFVNSISFPQQRWSGLFEYTVNLTAYNFHYCPDPEQMETICPGGQFPILNPVDQFDVQTNDDQTFSLTHTASAKGMGPIGDAGANDAIIDWVQARIATGMDRIVPGWNLENQEYYVVSEDEQINRFEGSYSFTRKYLMHKAGNAPETSKPMTRISATLNEGITQDYPMVSVNGIVKGGRTDDWNTSVLTTGWADLSEDSLRASASAILGGVNIPVECENYSFDEDYASNSVKAKASFQVRNSLDATGHFNHDISIDIDKITGVYKVDVDGQVECKGGIKKRQECIEAFLAANPDVNSVLFGIAQGAYLSIGGNGIQSLNVEALDLQITRNEKKGTLTLSASYNDERCRGGMTGESWDVTAKTSVPYTKANPSGNPGTNGYWAIQSFDFSTRWKLSINLALSFREDDSRPEATKEADARALLVGDLGTLAGAYGGWGGYVISESNNVSVGSITSGSAATELSYPATLPLIDINLASLLAPPQPR